MPFYRIGGVVMHLHVSRRAKMAPPCGFWVYVQRDGQNVRERCLAPTTHLCDWLGCNVPMCGRHAQELVPGFDFCPTHNSVRGLFSRLLPAPTMDPQR